MSFFKDFSKLREKASTFAAKGVSGAIAEVQGLVNHNHRHDEPHEIDADNVRASIRANHRFNSFAGERTENMVKWHVDGHDYMWAVSEMLESANEVIFIQDWWLSPELYLRRPPAHYPEWRIDRVLKRKAEQGVRVYVLIYKEVTQGMNMSSRHTKNHLHEMHSNIAVIRHPDHIGTIDSTKIWSHHEKVVVVDQNMACIGGLDLCFGRWDTPAHPIADAHPVDFSATLFPGQDYNNARVLDFQRVDNFASNQISILETPRMGWHDVHMSLVGPVVLDIVQHFVERWNELKKRKYRDNPRYDWLAFPHDIEAAPNEPVARHPDLEEWKAKGRRFRQCFHRGYGWRPQPNDLPSVPKSLATCKVQVCRSASDWSHGILKEDSIHNAYLKLIEEAEHHIYIENQFFISNTGKNGPVQNQIAKALVDRIIRAARAGDRFKVVVMIPEVPGFAGDISSSEDLKKILSATWRTINRGGHSIYEKIRAAGYEPKDYIRVYHLRSYDRINAPYPTFISRMEQNSGVTFHQAQIALAKQWLGTPDIWVQSTVSIKMPEPTTEGIVIEKTKTKIEEMEYPKTEKEARQIIEKFEAGAIGERLDDPVSDSVAHHALMDKTGLQQEKWLGSEQEELNCYVSEVLYIHSKVMVVDDKRVIMGSANINDRSQKGNGDSEIVLVVEDEDMVNSKMNGKPYQVSRFATTLRRRLYKEHLGLIPVHPVGEVNNFMRPAPTPNPDEFDTAEDDLVADPLSYELEEKWNGLANRNTRIFREIFRPVPSDLVRNFDQYKNYVPKTRASHVAPGVTLERVKSELANVRGHLVEHPLDFLIEETGLWEGNADWLGLNPTLPVLESKFCTSSILDLDHIVMRILPREADKLLLHHAGSLAQKRLARGLKLNLTEATALIASQLQERIRDGEHTVAELMQYGKTLLGRRHVLPGVIHQLHEIQVEGTFPDGVFLVTVHDPICTDSGDLGAALYGSFLPVPSNNKFPLAPPTPFSENPGAIIVKQSAPIVINEARSRVKLRVTNTGDRPIQIGSHYHFIETNAALQFDRCKAYGKRLDIPAGTAVRFEPGDTKTVTLVEIGGAKIVSGGNRLASGALDLGRTDEIVTGLVAKGFGHTPEPGALEINVNTTISREVYVSMFGPTVGDRVRLGDTSLWIEVEKDYTVYGDECKFGGGKVIREGMGQATNRPALECIDLLITNALIIDWSGIYKADIGVKDGLICGLGKAGNPDVMEGVDPKLIVGSSTEVVAGEGKILTAGAIDAHIHFICPQQCEEAIASGTTTFIGGGTGPSAGTSATTCTPSPFYMRHMFAATEHIPMNFAFTGKGNDSGPEALEDIVKAGAAGLKLHEDWGSTPAVITNALDVGDKYDVQVNIHTDTLNESGFVENTIEAFGGRTIHTYHAEGAGGGHAPDIIVVCEHENVLPSSTNPTRPFAHNTLDEHVDMLMVCHHLDKSIPEDVAFAESRIRGETVAAEDVLHDIGAISIISSDSQAMGRVGEVVSRTWRTAAKMRDMRGPLTELGDKEGADNGRVKRYVAKYTINPAIAHGISHMVGSVAIGALADLVLWKPENFGMKPEMILKCGVITWAQMGDANASIPTVQPVYSRPMWGAKAASAALNSVTFVSKISITSGVIKSYGLSRRFEAVKHCRSVKKKDMKWNSATPKMSVDPETYAVKADGVLADIAAATTLPLTRAYNLF